MTRIVTTHVATTHWPETTAQKVKAQKTKTSVKSPMLPGAALVKSPVPTRAAHSVLRSALLSASALAEGRWRASAQAASSVTA